MGLLDKIIRALEKHEVKTLKTKISRLDTEVTKQGKRVESLTVESRSKRFEFVLSDGTTNKKGKNRPAQPKKTGKNVKKPNRVTPVEKFPTDPPPFQNRIKTFVGRSGDYDEKCSWVEEYQPGVNVVLVVRRDGIRDILKVFYSNKANVPQNTIWWMENEEKVCQKLNVDAVRPRKEPLVSSWTYYVYPKIPAN